MSVLYGRYSRQSVRSGRDTADRIAWKWHLDLSKKLQARGRRACLSVMAGLLLPLLVLAGLAVHFP
jgi:thiosulfate reductase cytochrome b subunit